MVLLLLQWLINYFIKRIMQLMRVEEFIEQRSKIPSTYLKHYITRQPHFSLKHLIMMYLQHHISW